MAGVTMVGAVVFGGSALAAASGAALLTAPHGGVASAMDPRYTVVPQRQRLDAAGR